MLGEDSILRFNATLENCLKVSVGDTVFNLTKGIKEQTLDRKTMENPKLGGYFLPQ